MCPLSFVTPSMVRPVQPARYSSSDNVSKVKQCANFSSGVVTAPVIFPVLLLTIDY